MIYGSHFSTCTHVSLLIPSIQSPNQSSFSSSSYDPIVAFTGLLINPSHQHIHPSQVHDISHFCGHFLNIILKQPRKHTYRSDYHYRLHAHLIDKSDVDLIWEWINRFTNTYYRRKHAQTHKTPSC